MADDNVIEFSIKAKDEFSSVFQKFHSSIIGKVAEGVVAVSAAIFGFTKAVSESEVKIAKFALQTGLGTVAMSELAHAAELCESSIEEVGNGLKFMQRTMAEANQGNVQATKAFHDLGFSTRDASGHTKNANQALQEMADKFNAIRDPAERTRLAMQIFGRGGTDMIKIMAEGSEGMRKMAADAHFLGVVLSEQAAANAKEFDNQTNRLTQSIKGASMAIANEWIPILTGLTHALADQIAKWREPLKEFAQGAVTALLTVFATAEAVISGVYNFIVKSFSSAEGFDKFIENAKRAFMYLLDVAALGLKSFSLMMVGVFKLVWESFVELAKWGWMKMFDLLTGQNLADSLGEVLFSRIPEATRETVDEMKSVFNELKPEWEHLAIDGGKLMSDAFGISTEAIKQRVEELKRKFTELGQTREQAETNAANITIEQAYKQFLAQQQILTEQANAHIFAAQTIGETWSATWDLIAAKAMNTSQQLSQMIVQTFDQVTSGVGNAVARAVVLGQSLQESLKEVLRQVAMSIIEMLVKMGVQRLIFAALNVTTAATEAAANLASGFAQTYVNSFASAAAIPFYGWAIAPQVAAANLGLAIAGAGGAMATGKGMGAMVGAAHGGMTDVPVEGTFLLNKGERVLSPEQNKDLTAFMDSEGGGISVENLEMNITIDGGNFERMSAADLERLVGGKIYEAMNRLDRKGIRPGFIQRQRAR